MPGTRATRIDGRILVRFVVALGLLGSVRSRPGVLAADAGSGASPEALSGWRYVQDLRLPPDRTAPLDDFVLPPAVFDGARADLGDLRLYDPSGKEVPYALRVRRPQSHAEAIPANEFNRSRAADGDSEL